MDMRTFIEPLVESVDNSPVPILDEGKTCEFERNELNDEVDDGKVICPKCNKGRFKPLGLKRHQSSSKCFK